MTTSPATATIGWSRAVRLLPFAALLLAIIAAALLGAGPLGWRMGWLNYRVGLQTLLPWSGYCGIAAAGLGLATIGYGAATHSGRAAIIGAVAMAIGAAAAYVPWHYQALRGTFAPINDITTDWQNPPQFQAVLPMREAAHARSAYGGAEVSDQQRRWYPDIAPLMLDLPRPEAFERALATARAMGWTIVASDPAAGRIEASARSRWFGFVDDIAIRVEPSGQGTRIDVRSASRLGRGDFGVNAARIRAYAAALRRTAE